MEILLLMNPGNAKMFCVIKVAVIPHHAEHRNNNFEKSFLLLLTVLYFYRQHLFLVQLDHIKNRRILLKMCHSLILKLQLLKI